MVLGWWYCSEGDGGLGGKGGFDPAFDLVLLLLTGCLLG